MQTATALLTWLTDHALLVVAFTVTATVAGEQAVAVVRRRVDVAGSKTSIAGGTAYLVAKSLVSRGRRAPGLRAQARYLVAAP